ncbi:MAG: hypothetical protein U1E87_04620 [Alphaproteobacteria bacterium]
MSQVLRSILVGCSLALPAPALAAEKVQSPDRPYTQGSVWRISYVQTKPGHFEDYLNDIAKVFERFQEAQIAKGRVLSYKVLRLADARDNEPNLLLMVEFPNFAMLDTPDSVWDEARKELFGTMTKEHGAAIDREALRALRGEVLAQELKVPVQNLPPKK